MRHSTALLNFQTSLKRFFYLTLLTLFCGISFSQITYAQTPYNQTPTVLIVEVRDPARPQLYARELVALIRNKLPDHQIVHAKSSSQNFQQAQAEIKKSLADGLKGDQTVTHLFILSPTLVKQNPQTLESRIELYGLGSLLANGVSDSFADTFAALENKVSPAATVIFDACNSFCADRELAESASIQLASFLGIEKGAVFASLISNSFSIPLRTGSLIRAKPILFSAILGMSLATVMSPFIWGDESVTNFVTYWAGFAGSTTLLTLPTSLLVDLLMRAKNHLIERGLLLKISNEEIIEGDKIRKLKWYSEAFPQEAVLLSPSLLGTSMQNTSALMKSCAAKLGGGAKKLIQKVPRKNPFRRSGD